MEQSRDTTNNAIPRVICGEILIDDFNGLIICDRRVPELLFKIFCYIDDVKTLLNCQMVCKHWRTIVQNYVWRKKVELVLGKPFPYCKKIPWHVFYFLYKENVLKKIRCQYYSNCDCINDRDIKYWQLSCSGNIIAYYFIYRHLYHRSIKNYKEPIFRVTYTSQMINLIEEGLDSRVLDDLQPPITIREWYSCQADRLRNYVCYGELRGEEKKKISLKKKKNLNITEL